MNLKKLIKSLLVCGAMAIGTAPTPVLAADETDATVSVTKQLEFSEGLAIPDMKFEFDVTPGRCTICIDCACIYECKRYNI